MKIDLGKSLTVGDKVYGAYCGFAGSHPPTRLLVEELIESKDIATLSSWLTSPNLVVQTYAAEAFIRLAKDDISISQEDLDLVEEIRLKEDKISTCTGCIYEQLSIKECLKEWEQMDKKEGGSVR